MTRWRLRAALAAMALATSGVAFAQTPTTSVSDAVRNAPGPLTDADKALVDSVLKYQAAQMVQSTDDPPSRMKRIRDARDAVANACNGATPSFSQYFAQSLVANFLPATLGSNDVVVQVNAALAVGAIRQVAMLPALAHLAASPNAGVRYLAIKACKDLRPTAVPAGPPEIVNLLNVLRAAGKAGSSAAELSAIFQALDFTPKGDLANVPDAVLATARVPAIAVMGEIIAAQLRRVRDGQSGACAGLSEAAKTALSMGPTVSETERAQMLQPLADAMCQAGNAYLQLEGASSPPTELATALRDVEAAFLRITGTSDAAVARAIDGPAPRGNAVLVAVNEWVGTATTAGKLNTAPWNVKPPTPLPAGTPASRPATAPAATPATRAAMPVTPGPRAGTPVTPASRPLVGP